MDAADVSYNQEKIFNQVTASWDALYFGLPSTFKLNKFVDAGVTTRQRYEELPSCSNLDGLYLDPVFLVCKEIEHYALSPMVIFDISIGVPELRDAGNSWTLNFWVYVASESANDLIIHKDFTLVTKFRILYESTYELNL